MLKNYTVDCDSFLNSKGCGAHGPAQGELLGVVVVDGKAYEQYINIPCWVCPNCGRPARLSYRKIGPVVSYREETHTIDGVEWLGSPPVIFAPEPIPVHSADNFEWLPAGIRERVIR